MRYTVGINHKLVAACKSAAHEDLLLPMQAFDES